VKYHKMTYIVMVLSMYFLL